MRFIYCSDRKKLVPIDLPREVTTKSGLSQGVVFQEGAKTNQKNCMNEKISLVVSLLSQFVSIRHIDLCKSPNLRPPYAKDYIFYS